MILLWGVEEAPVRLLREALGARNARVLFLDHARLDRVEVDLEYAPGPSGRIDVGGAGYPVDQIRAIYVRPHDVRTRAGLGDQNVEDANCRHARTAQEMLWTFVDLADGLVLNRPSAMLSNGSKPYQSRLIAAHGFDVPDTLITTDPSALRRFRDEHRDVIYKSMSATRSIVSRVSDAHDARLEDLHSCPTQFQRHVDGIDYRVHVVGRELFASRVTSDAIDYRYGHSAIEPADLPDDVKTRCLSLSDALGLPLSGIDLRHSTDGRWFCFEVNPAPGYSAYEEVTGQRISAAIARLLDEHDRTW